MMDFIYELYQNDNFVLYLTIALVILIVLFVLVLIFGKRDQKLEETKRLQKIDIDAFKEEKKEETKLEVAPEPNKEENVIPEATVEEKIEVKPAETKKEVKSIFDDTAVLPIAKISEEPEEISVTTFEPTKIDIPEKIEEPKEEKLPSRKPLVDIEEESKPININELDEIKFDDINLEKDLGELENIRKEFDSIEIPEIKKEEKNEVQPKIEERKENKSYKAGPQIFSSVFVNKEDPIKVEVKEDEKTTVTEPAKKTDAKPKVNLFSIEDDDDEEIELPTLKSEAKKAEPKEEVKTFSFDDITGETYNIK